MSDLPSIRRFYTEDYAGSPSWFQRFINTLNLFTDPVYLNLQNGLTFQGNFNSQFYPLNITAGALASNNAVRFTSKVQGRANGLLPVACNLASNIQAPLANAVTIPSWYQDGKTIYITSITGLTPGSNYNLTVLLF